MKYVLVFSASTDITTSAVLDYLNDFDVPWFRINVDCL